MIHPFISHRLNRGFRRPDVDRLPQDSIDYAEAAIRGLHIALHAQTEPPYRQPEHPVDGWGLVATQLSTESNFAGIPVVALLGHRAIYLSAEPKVMFRVLTTPHPQRILDEQVIQVRRTSVPLLLEEDPTLYFGLLNGADANIRIFSLDYQLPEAPKIS